MQVENILQTKGHDVITVAARATIGEAVELLNGKRIGAVVVTDGGKVVGILSERDVVRHLGTDWTTLASRPVGDVMTRNVITTSKTASVADLMESMTQHRIRHMPVVEGAELVGIVSIGDIAVKEGKDRRTGDTLEDISRGVKH